jgi:hypothetical protein
MFVYKVKVRSAGIDVENGAEGGESRGGRTDLRESEAAPHPGRSFRGHP